MVVVINDRSFHWFELSGEDTDWPQSSNSHPCEYNVCRVSELTTQTRHDISNVSYSNDFHSVVRWSDYRQNVSVGSYSYCSLWKLISLAVSVQATYRSIGLVFSKQTSLTCDILHWTSWSTCEYTVCMRWCHGAPACLMFLPFDNKYLLWIAYLPNVCCFQTRVCHVYLMHKFRDLALGRFKVIQGQRRWCQSIAHGWLPIRLLLTTTSYLTPPF